MKSILFMASVVAGAVALAPACSANLLVVGHEVDAADASVGRDSETADAGPGDRDGGNDDGSLPDTGSGRDGAVADAAPGHADGGKSDGGVGAACASAGGTCIGITVACAIDAGAPTAAQDCPHPMGFSYCCLHVQ